MKLSKEQRKKILKSLEEGVMEVAYFEEAYNWKNPEDLYKVCIKQQQEIERLHSIIKEVREKIKNTKFAFDFDKEIKKVAFDLTYTKEGQELLQILDKENKKWK